MAKASARAPIGNSLFACMSKLLFFGLLGSTPPVSGGLGMTAALTLRDPMLRRALCSGYTNRMAKVGPGHGSPLATPLSCGIPYTGAWVAALRGPCYARSFENGCRRHRSPALFARPTEGARRAILCFFPDERPTWQPMIR